jgi:hypothetical protein
VDLDEGGAGGLSTGLTVVVGLNYPSGAVEPTKPQLPMFLEVGSSFFPSSSMIKFNWLNIPGLGSRFLLICIFMMEDLSFF